MLRQVQKVAPRLVQRSMSSLSAQIPEAQLSQTQKDAAYPKLGNRDIVGYGMNGLPTYIDLPEFPAPAVRYGENTAEVVALREKEKGDWNSLSVEEKKALYRASFRETYSEMKAPNGEWKSVLAGVILGISLTGWVMIWMKQNVYPPLPHTINEEYKEGNLKMMVKQNQGPITGVASKYDYENNRWK
uniref:Cytochrome c oxidase subunit 4 n=1 Tax=Urechis caupo TaxID=6431 RepID=Q27123_URECA|nr:cytochrome c oxidase subunit IV [Urechis caupo]